MNMRSLVFAALSATILAAPTLAAEIKFAPNTFVILGGMGETQVASATMPHKQAKSFAADDVSGPNRATIDFATDLKPGSILVRTAERKLYFILPAGQAIMSGTNQISRKASWPDWRPPAVMIKREAERGHIIPDFMAGGPQNPLGARAMYIGSTDFRIHGTTQPWSIGHAVSSGCIRMLNEHVIDLFNRVKIGAKVVVE
jgi:lipoprotein-anchoring transpeptidase ErfK/SrfK